MKSKLLYFNVIEIESEFQYHIMLGAVTDKSQPRHKKYTQFYREEGVFFGIIYV